MLRALFLRLRWLAAGVVLAYLWAHYWAVQSEYGDRIANPTGPFGYFGLRLDGLHVMAPESFAWLYARSQELERLQVFGLIKAPAPVPAATPPSAQQDPSYTKVADYNVGPIWDDSWQFKTEPLDKEGPLGIVYRTWVCKKQALRHGLAVRVDAPASNDQLRSLAERCLTTAAVTGVIAGLATMDGETGYKTFHAALAACVGNEAVRTYLVDTTHWTDWSNCT